MAKRIGVAARKRRRRALLKCLSRAIMIVTHTVTEFVDEYRFTTNHTTGNHRVHIIGIGCHCRDPRQPAAAEITTIAQERHHIRTAGTARSFNSGKYPHAALHWRTREIQNGRYRVKRSGISHACGAVGIIHLGHVDQPQCDGHLAVDIGGIGGGHQIVQPRLQASQPQPCLQTGGIDNHQVDRCLRRRRVERDGRFDRLCGGPLLGRHHTSIFRAGIE